MTRKLGPSFRHRWPAEVLSSITTSDIAGEARQHVLELAECRGRQRGRVEAQPQRLGAHAGLDSLRFREPRAPPPRSARSARPDWATTQVVSRSLWSTLPRTRTIESVASASSLGGQRLVEDDDLDRGVEVVERGEHHPVALLGLDLLGLGDHAADRHPVTVAPTGDARPACCPTAPAAPVRPPSAGGRR